MGAALSADRVHSRRCGCYFRLAPPVRARGSGACTTESKPAHLERAEKFLARLHRWALDRDDVRALAVVGSFARGDARPDSDVDVVLLAVDPRRYLDDTTWLSIFGDVESDELEAYGRVTSIRAHLDAGLEIEIGVAPADWASAPYDAGTELVARGGIVILMDRDGHATALANDCAARQGRQ